MLCKPEPGGALEEREEGGFGEGQVME